MVCFLLCLASFLQYEGVACAILLAIYFVCVHVQVHKCVLVVCNCVHAGRSQRITSEVIFWESHLPFGGKHLLANLRFVKEARLVGKQVQGIVLSLKLQYSTQVLVIKLRSLCLQGKHPSH